MNLDDYIRFNRLYDLYGKLLTDRQCELVRLHVREDLSLFEISQSTGITRQAVSDALGAARTKLEDYEQRLGFARQMENALSVIARLRPKCESHESAKLVDELYGILNFDEED